MSVLRKTIALPFLAIGLAFTAVGALILGDNHLDLIQDQKPHH